MDKRLYIALAALIVLIVAFLIVTSYNTNAQNGIDKSVGMQVPASVVAQLSIPSAISNKIGIGSVQYFPKIVAGPKLLDNSKPEILYIGAEYCPYCAVTRWGMIIALMRFGNFSNLHYMASNGTDVFPNTPTFDFYNSTYTSNYVTFVSVETTTRNHNVQLQVPTALQNKIFTTYNPPGGIPFIDFANFSIVTSSPVLPSTLQGQEWDGVIANLTNTNSSVAQALVGSANLFTAQICQITNETPQSVCAQPYVQNIQRNNLG